MKLLYVAIPVLALAGIGGYQLFGSSSVDVDAKVAERMESDPTFDASTDGVKTTKNTIAYDADNKGMQAAYAKARKTLPRFFELMETNVAGTYTIKFPLTQDGQTEHIWMEFEDIKDGKFVGRLSNDPIHGTQYKLGDSVSVALADMEDWVVATDDGIYGGQTLRYMLKDMPEDQADALRAMLRD